MLYIAAVDLGGRKCNMNNGYVLLNIFPRFCKNLPKYSYSEWYFLGKPVRFLRFHLMKYYFTMLDTFKKLPAISRAIDMR